MEKKHVPFRTKMRGGPLSFGLFTQLSGSLLKDNEWFLPPWKLACTPSWMSPQNASSESSSSKHEELSKPSPESTRTWTHKLFLVCVSLFNLNFSPPPAVPILDRIGFQFLKLGKLIFLYPRFNDFFSHRESVGTLHVSFIFSFWGGRFHEESSFIFQTLYSTGFGFNFFINLRRLTPTMLCKLLLLFATTVWFTLCCYCPLLFCFLRTLRLPSGDGFAEDCNWTNLTFNLNYIDTDL